MHPINPNIKILLLCILLFALSTFASTSIYAQSEHSNKTETTKENIIAEQIQNLIVINKSGKVFIKWTQLPSESNCMLSIEKSDNGTDFIEIGNKKGIISDFVLFYSFIDHNPSQSISYYKIKHTNSNGEVSYSAIRQTKIVAKEELANNYLSTASLN